MVVKRSLRTHLHLGDDVLDGERLQVDRRAYRDDKHALLLVEAVAEHLHSEAAGEKSEAIGSDRK